MTPGERLQNAQLKPASKKRKNKEVVADVDHTFFWLAQVQRRSRVNAMDGDSPVPFTAEKDDPGWDLTRGEWILNIRWLKRLRAKVWTEASEQTIALTSVLPLKVVWHSTTRNQMTLSEAQHQELLHMCKEVKALDPRWQVKAASKAQQAPNGGSS